MRPKPTIMKFGGTSLEDAPAFEQASRIIRARDRARAVVVVSAMSRVTDALLDCTEQAANLRVGEATRNVARLLERYAHVAQALLTATARAPVEADIERSRADLFALLEAVARRLDARPLLQDEIVSHGERLSALLLTAVLTEHGLAAHCVDARRCIVTDDAHGLAAPIRAATEQRTRAVLEPLLDSSVVPVLGGFIAATVRGATTTLGRNGSDYTAALVAAALDAAELQIWTDVAGVLTADPRVVGGARTVPYLSYAEAETLASYGAKVLHPKTIQPVCERGIPVRICCSHAPEESVTLVSAQTNATPPGVKAIAYKRGVALLHIMAGALTAGNFRHDLSGVLERHPDVLNLISTCGAGATLTCEDGDLASVYAELRQLGAIRIENNRALVCVAGAGLRATPWIAARARDALGDIEAACFAAGQNLLFVVYEPQVGEVVMRLHEAFFARGAGGYQMLESYELERVAP